MRQEDEWILTYSGKAYWPLDPQPEDVCLEDIAHGLSMLCRYSGQSRYFYSVAEHSILVSYMVPKDLALEALMHDASEAYCSDVTRPLKQKLPDYKRIEKMNDLVIRTHFHLPHFEHPLVKQADTNILLSEALELLPFVPWPRKWTVDGILDPNVVLKFWFPPIAEQKFLERFAELTKEGV